MDESREIFLNAVRASFEEHARFITNLEDEAKTNFEFKASDQVLASYLEGLVKLRDKWVKVQLPEEDLATHDALVMRVRALLPDAVN